MSLCALKMFLRTCAPCSPFSVSAGEETSAKCALLAGFLRSGADFRRTANAEWRGFSGKSGCGWLGFPRLAVGIRGITNLGGVFSTKSGKGLGRGALGKPRYHCTIPCCRNLSHPEI